MVAPGVLLALGPYYYVLRPRINAYRSARYVQYAITNRRAMMLCIKDGQIVEERIKPLNVISSPRLAMLNSKGIGNVVFDAGGAIRYGGDDAEDVSHYDINS